MARRKTSRSVEVLVHDEASRKNIPTAEHEPVMADDDRNPVEVAPAPVHTLWSICAASRGSLRPTPMPDSTRCMRQGR